MWAVDGKCSAVWIPSAFKGEKKIPGAKLNSSRDLVEHATGTDWVWKLGGVLLIVVPWVWTEVSFELV